MVFSLLRFIFMLKNTQTSKVKVKEIWSPRESRVSAHSGGNLPGLWDKPPCSPPPPPPPPPRDTLQLAQSKQSNPTHQTLFEVPLSHFFHPKTFPKFIHSFWMGMTCISIVTSVGSCLNISMKPEQSRLNNVKKLHFWKANASLIAPFNVCLLKVSDTFWGWLPYQNSQTAARAPPWRRAPSSSAPSTWSPPSSASSPPLASWQDQRLVKLKYSCGLKTDWEGWPKLLRNYLHIRMSGKFFLLPFGWYPSFRSREI